MVSSADIPTATSTGEHDPISIRQSTACCIVGGGPGGLMLGLLLARNGVRVTLLEEHRSFERDFRGDSLQPSVLEIMDDLDLTERLLQLPHSKIHRLTYQISSTKTGVTDYSRLKTRHPYITRLPQAQFLDFIAAEARRYPNFTLVMGARVEELISAGEWIGGVRYRAGELRGEIRATLTVAADGRFSRVRRLLGLEPIRAAAPMDILWFRLPRQPDDPDDSFSRIGGGAMLTLLNRHQFWQVGYTIPKGSYGRLRESGIETLRRSIATLVPEVGHCVEHLRDWKQIALLSVELSRLQRWYRPGLLLIGDAAHVMSPVNGVGVACAIQDAVVAANLLSQPLRAGQVRIKDLAAVQRRREWPTRLIQSYQALLQRQIIAGALKTTDKPFKFPPILGFLASRQSVRDLTTRMIAFGVWPVHVKR